MASTFGPSEKQSRITAAPPTQRSFGNPPPSVKAELPPPPAAPFRDTFSNPEPPRPPSPQDRINDATSRGKRIQVDESEDRIVPIRNSSVVFRPRQVITDPFVLAIAEQYGIALTEH